MTVVATSTMYANPVTVDPVTGAGIGGLGPAGIVTPEAIRIYLRDDATHNILANYKSEISDAQVAQAIMGACSTFNSIPPLGWAVKLDGSDWPTGHQHMLIQGASAWILKGIASHQLRNQYNSTDGNVPHMGIHDKYQQFMHFASDLLQQFRNDVSHLKVVTDLEQASVLSQSPLGNSSWPY